MGAMLRRNHHVTLTTEYRKSNVSAQLAILMLVQIMLLIESLIEPPQSEIAV
jgi:hypothetical protein